MKGTFMSAKRIGILTGGGDVPGLNSVIKSVVYRSSELGGEVIGIRRGWEGLTHVNLDDPESKARYIMPLNGDDTLGYASRLGKEGIKVLAIPKTMDNDVRNTEYCIGFSTAITRATEAIERQRTTVGSHERIGIFRIFGRDAGYTSLYSAYVTSIRCCIPEYRFDAQKLFDLLMKDKRDNPSNYALVVLSEGANWQNHGIEERGEADAYG